MQSTVFGASLEHKILMLKINKQEGSVLKLYKLYNSLEDHGILYVSAINSVEGFKMLDKMSPAIAPKITMYIKWFCLDCSKLTGLYIHKMRCLYSALSYTKLAYSHDHPRITMADIFSKVMSSFSKT